MEQNQKVNLSYVETIDSYMTADEYLPLSRILDTFNPDGTLQERGTRTPTFDTVDAVGIDITSDFHSDAFDQFEFVRDNSATDAEKHANAKYWQAQFDARNTQTNSVKTDSDPASVQGA